MFCLFIRINFPDKSSSNFLFRVSNELVKDQNFSIFDVSLPQVLFLGAFFSQWLPKHKKRVLADGPLMGRGQVLSGAVRNLRQGSDERGVIRNTGQGLDFRQFLKKNSKIRNVEEGSDNNHIYLTPKPLSLPP